MLYKEFNTGPLSPHGKDEWLKARQQFITATELATLVGLNPWSNLTKLQREKNGEIVTIDNQNMYIGRILEPAVIKAMREKLEWDVRPWCADDDLIGFYAHEELGLSATPDAKLLYHTGEMRAIIECKTTNESSFNRWSGEVPLYYLLQVHAQMIVIEHPSAYIACLGAFRPFPLVVYQVIPSDEINELIKKVLDEYWQNVYNDTTYKVDVKIKNELSTLLRKNIRKIYS